MKKTVDLFFKLLEFLVVASLVAMVIMVFGNVVLRYGFNSGITVSEEMSRYCFIWLTYIGAMIAMRERGHLGVDTMVKHLPVMGKKVCLFISEALMLFCNGPNALIQESVRAFYTGWYRELVTELPLVKDGMVTLGDKPGLGLELLPDLHKRADAVVKVS